MTALSAFVKNVGALAMLMPVAFQLARRSGTSPSSLLMPMSFGALLGGIVTLVGTSPNIIVSRVREQLLGEPFNMFDFTPVGIGIAAAGFIFLVFGWRLLPRRKGAASMDAAFRLEGYTTEVTVPEDSPAAGITVKALEELGEEGIEVITLLRSGSRRYEPAGNVVIKAGDVLILQGEPAALERVVALENLQLTREGRYWQESDWLVASMVRTADGDVGGRRSEPRAGLGTLRSGHGPETRRDWRDERTCGRSKGGPGPSCDPGLGQPLGQEWEPQGWYRKLSYEPLHRLPGAIASASRIVALGVLCPEPVES